MSSVDARAPVGSADARALAAIHEIRGPLSVISLALALWHRRGQVAGEELRGLELELQCAARALRALEDLHREPREMARALDASAWLAPAELISCTVEAMQGLAAHHGTTLSGAWTGRGAWVWGDRVGLSSAIANLITNALEHGGGAVVVHGCLRGRVARVQVSDRGPGLPAPVAALIGRAPAVQPAAQAEAGIQPSADGTGCQAGARACARGWGLRIAAEVAARHGGRIGAAPSAQGARLVLELPAVPAGAAAPRRRSG